MAVECDGEPIELEVARTDEFALCRQAEFNDRGANVNTVAFLSPFEKPDGDPYNPAALALTILWRFEDGEIVDADILINEEMTPHAVCPEEGCVATPGAQAAIDLQNIVTHEAGHFFGLGHSDVEGSTMLFDSPRGEVTKRTLAQDDIDGLCTIYPPGSVAGGCDFAPRGGLQVEDCSVAVADSGGGCSAYVGSDMAPAGAWWLLLALVAILRSHDFAP